MWGTSGLPLSPTLFLIYNNDLLQSLEALSPVRFQAYADDLIIWVQGLFRDGFTHPMLSCALEMLTQWSLQWRLRFHPGKCCAICFHGAQVWVRRHFEAKLYGTIIPYTPEVQYVGLWLDEQMTWRKHIQEKTSKAMARIRQLRRAVRTQWGLSCYQFLQLIHGAVIPLLFYGAECWAGTLISAQLLGQLDRVLSYAGRLSMGLESTTSTDATLKLANIFPASFQILQRLLRFMLRKHRATLMEPMMIPSRFYVSPASIGVSWCRRLWESVPTARVRKRIDEGLRAAWQRTWSNATQGLALRHIFPTVSTHWLPPPSLNRGQATLLARFLMGHCHVGSLALPWHDEDDFEECVCGEVLSRHHLCFECPRLTEIREPLLRAVSHCPCPEVGWLVRWCPQILGTFLQKAQAFFGD